MLNSIVDRYTDIGCKIYDEMSWTQNHNIKTDVATNCKEIKVYLLIWQTTWGILYYTI